MRNLDPDLLEARIRECPSEVVRLGHAEEPSDPHRLVAILRPLECRGEIREWGIPVDGTGDLDIHLAAVREDSVHLSKRTAPIGKKLEPVPADDPGERAVGEGQLHLVRRLLREVKCGPADPDRRLDARPGRLEREVELAMLAGPRHAAVATGAGTRAVGAARSEIRSAT